MELLRFYSGFNRKHWKRLFNSLKNEGNFIGSKKKLSASKFREMLEINGTATLSQISRAYLTSVTSLSGIPPINLPMINVYAMKKYKENNK